MAVTSTNNLQKGSKGNDVLELQKLLNQNGYNLAEDGSFGAKTLAAVKDYQQKNNLTVDGIVGTNTWGALTKASSTSSSGSKTSSTSYAGSTTPEATKTPTFEYTPYTPSDTVKQAEALLQQQLANKPGAYTSPWQSQLNEIIQQIQNREKFSYDLNADALYQQYKDQYTTQGKLAMMDTMGQAQAMTGGYGNSYAQTVGQQAYQGYLQQLNERVPELYQLALSQYNKEGDDMYNQASLIAGMEEQEYGRYRDQVSDYYTELDRLTDDSRYKSEQEYSKWADDMSFQYQQERDKIADQQWQAQFDEAKRQYDQSYALSAAKSNSSSSSTKKVDSGGDKTGSGYDNGSLSQIGVMALQKALGDVEVDGKWGPKSQAAALKKWGVSSADDAYKIYTGGKDLDLDGYEDQPAGNTGFTGNTYEEAVAYMKSKGVSSSAANVMTKSEWTRRRSSYLTYGTGGAEVKNYSSYQAYLADYVEYAIENKSSSSNKSGGGGKFGAF